MGTREIIPKAYRTVAAEIESIIWTKTAGMARAITLRSAEEAGYKIKFTDITVRRAQEYDNKMIKPDRCYAPEYI